MTAYNVRKDWGRKERISLMIPAEMLDAANQIQQRRVNPETNRVPSLSSVVSELLERGLLEVGAEYTAQGDPLCTSSGKLVL